MAHQRNTSTVDGVKEPHSVSLKVLRLSRPSLVIQHPLPTPLPSPTSQDGLHPSQSASLAYPSSKPENNNFILSPLLTLPPAFGSAYVGETFSCTLCANNELLPSSTPPKNISNVRIEAEMKIPSSSAPIVLELGPSPDAEHKEGGEDLEPGRSLQKVVSFDLKEEGSHVLAVTVTYSETTPTSGRVRTFRKLYQFVCKGCMVVRTKTGILPPGPALKTGEEEGSKRRRWALEAQLENCGEETLMLDTVVLETKDSFKSTGLNWEMASADERPVLNPGDVQQVCFLIEEIAKAAEEPEDGRLVFGILSLSWRGNMGNKGFLSTGSLGTRLK